jgi:16S rRNA (cytidine1402-2'-O)-methyltransferase
VRDARARGLAVLPVPGPSAAIAALSVSGLPTDRFLFVGFLPARQGQRRAALDELRDERATLVLYESPLRVAATLRDLLDALGDREAFLCREATKRHEEYKRGRLSSLLAELDARARVRGEVVLIVSGAPAAPATEAPADSELERSFVRLVAEGRTRREAAKQLAKQHGLPAREVYKRLVTKSRHEA